MKLIGIEGKRFNNFEWSLLRQSARSFKRQRLFSEAFIEEERSKLDRFRETVRKIM